MNKNLFRYYFREKPVLSTFTEKCFSTESESNVLQNLLLAVQIATNPNISGDLLNITRLHITECIYQNALVFGLYIIEHELQKKYIMTVPDYVSTLHNYGINKILMQRDAFKTNSIIINNREFLCIKSNNHIINLAEDTNTFKKNNINKKSKSFLDYVRKTDTLTGFPRFIKDEKNHCYIKAFNSNFLYYYLFKYSNKDCLIKKLSNPNNYTNSSKHYAIIDDYNNLINDLNNIDLYNFTDSDKIIWYTLINNCLFPFEINEFSNYIDKLSSLFSISGDPSLASSDIVILFNLANKLSLPFSLIVNLAYSGLSLISIYQALNTLTEDLIGIYRYILHTYYLGCARSMEKIKEDLLKDLESYYLIEKIEDKLPSLTLGKHMAIILEILASSTKNQNLYFENINKKKADIVYYDKDGKILFYSINDTKNRKEKEQSMSPYNLFE